jgi:hypothetical protein
MGIGASVFLLAVGGILGFAVNDTVAGVDIHLIGFILMAAGLLGLFMTTVLFGRRDRVATTAAPVTTTERVVTRDVY